MYGEEDLKVCQYLFAEFVLLISNRSKDKKKNLSEREVMILQVERWRKIVERNGYIIC